jgi:hypothetical protein
MEKNPVARLKTPKKRPGLTGQARGDIGRDFASFIDKSDAKKFAAASSQMMKRVGSSRAEAIKVLKSSGYLDAAGTVAKRYR